MICKQRKLWSLLAIMVLVNACSLRHEACDLCAIYSADNARGGTANGFQFTVSEQYTSYRTLQLDSVEFAISNPEHVEESITHLVPSYNFNRSFGLSLNVPYVHKSYYRYAILNDEGGEVSGVGDAAVVGRFLVFAKARMDFSMNLNFLAGVKLPTGDSTFLQKEADESRFYSQLFGAGHSHGVIPLIGGVHYHNLTLGSGSFDGIFGVNFNTRWKRSFLSAQGQYYLRTEGRATFEFGDMLMFSGGPGFYLFSNDKFTLNLQANAVFLSETRARLFGQEADQTGVSAYFLGPQVGMSIGKHFTSTIGVDIPLAIHNSGLQTVYEYRIHGSLSWRF